MPKKGSERVTLTLYRKTVAMLRAKKEGLETWDDLMYRLGKRRRYGIECTICGAFLESENLDKSPNMLAKENGWEAIYSGRVEVDEKIGIKTSVKLGYICKKCGEK